MTLHEFFTQHPKATIACSGGVDSSYLLYAAQRAGADVTAYYVKSVFQPNFELADAKSLTGELGIPLKILTADVLADPRIRKNPENRCYYCKHRIFSTILQVAKEDGCPVLCDGTNASDAAADRPGMKALSELSVLSPLRICGITKDEIRKASMQAGLFTWDKPAYACLATRIPTGEEITEEALSNTEAAEAFLRSLGFYDLRVRKMGTAARIQVPEEQLEEILNCRERILLELGKYYSGVRLDLKPRE